MSCEAPFSSGAGLRLAGGADAGGACLSNPFTLRCGAGWTLAAGSFARGWDSGWASAAMLGRSVAKPPRFLQPHPLIVVRILLRLLFQPVCIGLRCGPGLSLPVLSRAAAPAIEWISRAAPPRFAGCGFPLRVSGARIRLRIASVRIWLATGWFRSRLRPWIWFGCLLRLG